MEESVGVSGPGAGGGVGGGAEEEPGGGEEDGKGEGEDGQRGPQGGAGTAPRWERRDLGMGGTFGNGMDGSGTIGRVPQTMSEEKKCIKSNVDQ